MGSVTLDLRIWYGYRIQEGAGVWMYWAIEQFITAGEFNQVAKIHNCDSVRNMPYHAQVVRNEQIG
jgi:hypothetical protein